MNVMSFEALPSLRPGIDKALADPSIKGIVITSARRILRAGWT